MKCISVKENIITCVKNNHETECMNEEGSLESYIMHVNMRRVITDQHDLTSCFKVIPLGVRCQAIKTKPKKKSTKN